MELSENIAQISLEPQTHSVKHIALHVNNLRFKCKRCATFCCKLGGQKLSARDIERLKKTGHCETGFLDVNNSRLKSTANGSCVCLKFDAEKQTYECVVYNHRPTLCRLYPFHFEKTNTNDFILQIIPCMGLNRRYGEIINETFIIGKLLDALKAFNF
jgi:Fe-S-cluster containining protein